MTRRLRGYTVRALLLLACGATPVMAQSTMTITGHISSATNPVRGARVRIDSLDLNATTDINGRYSFIVPSIRVRGQKVVMTVNYPRFRPQTAEVELVGGNIVKDFELTAITLDANARPEQAAASTGTSAAAPPNGPPGTGVAPAAVPQSRPAVAPVTKPAEPTPVLPVPVSTAGVVTIRATVPVQAVDSSVFTDLAGSVDVAGALEGRMAGVDVQTSSAPGGTNSIVVRGPRTLFGITQPLVVVNGIIVDNSNLTTAAQRSGLGGFDYGTLLSDLNVEDIASLQLLTGPEAALRYGGRGANGVLVITTRSSRGLSGFEVAASQQVSGMSIIKLPDYQNVYGQGLGGKFAFFNGKGGGINDATDQSWGPQLNNAPVLQASYLEAARADVRNFSAFPSNVSNYFSSAHALATNVSLLGGNESSYMRGSVSNRTLTGVEPQSSIATRSGTITAGTHPSDALSFTGDLQYSTTTGEGRPGSGFDESNTISTFSHMPRQIDVATYQKLLRDATGNMLSWNYAGHNNPWTETLENQNHDDRSRVIGGASATLALSKALSLSGRFGTDHSSDSRTFSVAGGWMGGYPYYLGRGDFSSGGFENDAITRTQTNADVILRAAPVSTSDVSFAFTAGAGRRTDNIDFGVTATDKLVSSATPPAVDWTGSTSATYLFGGLETFVRDAASLTVGARQESSSPTGLTSASTLYPAIVGSVDLARLDSGARHDILGSFVVHGGWSKSGNDVTSSMLQRLGFGPGSTLALSSALAGPETTSGWEAGVSTSMFDRRLTANVTAYDELSENLIFPSATTFVNTGTMSNKGIEAAVTIVPVRAANGGEWSIGANISKNTNLVESLGGASSVALAAPFNDLTVEARPGSSLGVLVGYGFRRDAAGNMLLVNGLPVADSAAGRKVLAETQPAWIGGISTGYRTHGLELSMLVDAHHGGKIFSASNRAGAVAGVLAETANRPDSGQVIPGLDATTGAANTTKVTTEAYYHALEPITERWLYDASFVKLREVRVSYVLPLQWASAVRAQSIRASFIGRNLALWSNAPNIDPETVLSTSTLRGVEMGQLPSVRALGVQLTLVP